MRMLRPYVGIPDPGHLVISSPGHLVTWSPGHLVI
jgi:hypothetical protein